MPTVRDDAICIRLWDWSETSQTVSLFGRELGVLRAVAKGAKRERAPFSGGLEVMTRGEMIAIVKGNERSPDAMGTLTAWDLQETFPAARRSLDAFHAGMYLLDLVHHAVRDGDPHPALYDGLVQSLRALDHPGGVQGAVLWFQWLTLAQLGVAPELERDARTQRPVEPAESYGFAPSLGGIVRDPERPGTSRPGEEGTPVWRVRAETVRALRGLIESQRRGEGPAAAASTIGDAGTIARGNRLLARYLSVVLGHWPASARAAFPGLVESDP